MDEVMVEYCMRCDHIYEEVWTSLFTEARAEDAPELDKTSLGSGRLSLGLKYSRKYRCDMVLRNVYTFTTRAMCCPMIRF